MPANPPSLARRTLRAGTLVALALLAATPLCRGATDVEKSGALWSQSITLEKNSDYKGAIAKMAELERAGTDLYLVNLRTGWLCYLNKDYDRAIVRYHDAAGRMPAAISPLLGLANTYRAKGDNDNAERVCKSIVAREAGNVTALQMLGAIYFEKKDYPNAASAYDAILKLYPEDTTALSGYGWARLYQSRKVDAVPIFQRLLVLSPNFTDAQQGYTAAITQ